jgi:hypothetical protein
MHPRAKLNFRVICIISLNFIYCMFHTYGFHIVGSFYGLCTNKYNYKFSCFLF